MHAHIPTRIGAIALAVIASWILAKSVSSSPLAAFEAALVELYQEKSDAIVRVKVATRSPESNNEEDTTLTVISGFFIDKKGTVLTNAIPDRDVVRLWIVKDGISYLAEPVGTDKLSNISMLRAINLPASFSSIQLSTPATKPPLSSFAFAITSPIEFAPTPQLGLVSGYESEFSDITFPFTYTRVSIPLGPAEGGSPVFSRTGELIGICVAALPEIDSAYVVPTEALQRIATDLAEKGHAVYGSIPVSFEESPEPNHPGRRVRVSHITPKSQADKAGIRAGDKIVASGETPIANVNQLRDLIFYQEPGSFLSLTIWRDGAELEFALLIEAQEAPPALATRTSKTGEGA